MSVDREPIATRSVALASLICLGSLQALHSVRELLALLEEEWVSSASGRSTGSIMRNGEPSGVTSYSVARASES
jgi:hypothetical protein